MSKKESKKKTKERKLHTLDYFLIIVVVLFVILFLLGIHGKSIKFAGFKSFKDLTTSAQEEENEIDKALLDDNDKLPVENNVFNPEPPAPDITIKLSAIGDIMAHNTQITDAYDKTLGYDFSKCFKDIPDLVQDSDFFMGNLETTFAGSKKKYSGYPQFNTPEQLATDLKELGLDLVTTANNHSLDTGYAGVESTIAFLDEAGLPHTGTFNSQESHDQIYVTDINGIKTAFLAYTYGTNGIPIPSGKEYCINLIDRNLISKQIKEAKDQECDLIVVSMHWGVEYRTSPTAEQKELAEFLFKEGADVIIGSHPHVLEPFEKREITLDDGTKKDGFVIYSMGNFISGQTQANTRNSILLHLTITKNGKTGKISIDKVEYDPLYTYTYPKMKNYKVIDLRRRVTDYEAGVDNLIGKSDYDYLKPELDYVDNLLNPEG